MLKRIIKQMETDLTVYDQILLVKNDTDEDMKLAESFLAFAVSWQTNKKVLILSPVDFSECSGVLYRKISKEEENSILKMYNMYEFSNRISVISHNGHFGSLLNYFETGVLTLKEMFRAMLY